MVALDVLLNSAALPCVLTLDVVLESAAFPGVLALDVLGEGGALVCELEAHCGLVGGC